MMFKKKPDLPPRPPVPSMNQIIEDLENAPLDDPTFAGAPELRDDSKDSSFTVAQEFMAKTQRLKELESLLIQQKAELERSCMDLQEIRENIKKESLQALQPNIYCDSE